MANLLIAHGGAPTAVINASLYGAVMEAKRFPGIEHIYAAVYGSAGILNEQFTDLAQVPEEELEKLLRTPGSAIGTSRTHLEPEDYAAMAQILKKHDIRYVLFTGGNGSMDTCGHLRAACGNDVFVAGIPKTIDNDISVIDHAPGYGSAANFIVQCVSEIAHDVRSLPIHVSIIETMGRNAGWITAAAALARRAEGDAPDIICLPEVPFDEERFLARVRELHDKKDGVVVVVSEGLKNADGSTVAPPLFEEGRARYDGDVGTYLARLIIEKLSIKARSEKPGIWGRACAQAQSSIDREEAVRMGALAARAVLSGKSGVMAGLMRCSTDPYICEDVLVPIEQVMLEERLMPKEFISDDGFDVTDAFCEWCRPLLGSAPAQYADFKHSVNMEGVRLH